MTSSQPCSSSSRAVRLTWESVRLSILPAIIAAVTSWPIPSRIDAVDAFAGRGRDLLPVGVAEEGALGGTVEVLDGTATGLGFDQFDAVVFEQRLDVVADVAERLAEFLGELVGARDPFLQGREDANAQRVGERLRELLGDALWGRSGLSQRGCLRSRFVGGGRGLAQAKTGVLHLGT